MDDIWKIIAAGIFALIGSHLLLYSWLKRKIAAIQVQVEREKAQEATRLQDGSDQP